MATLRGKHANTMSVFYFLKNHFLGKIVLKFIGTILCKTFMWLLNFFCLKGTLSTEER